MSVKILPYTKDLDRYIDNFEYNGVESVLFDDIDIKQRIKMYAKIGEAFIGLDNDKMIGAGGIIKVYDGIGFAWILLNRDISFFFVRKIKKFLKESLKFYHRIETYCLANCEKASKFLEYLGFKKEGLMRKHIKQKDTFLYALIRED